MTEHRVVEVSPVTDDELTDALNRLESEGWKFEHADYMKDDGVRRPQMAYLYFFRKSDND